MAINNDKKKNGRGTPNQVNQAAQGTQGTAIDNSGTGVNTNKTMAGRLLSLGGINPEVQNIPLSQAMRNTASNLAPSNLISSVSEGAGRSLGEMKDQFSNFERLFKEGATNIAGRLADNAANIQQIPSVVNRFNTPAEGSSLRTNEPTTSGELVGPSFPSESTSGAFRLGQTPEGKLTFEDDTTSSGSIQFKDQRRLSQDQLDRLAKDFERNANPEFQARLARDAALSQSRYDQDAARTAERDRMKELDFFKKAHLDAIRNNDLVSVSQFSKRIKDLEGAGLVREKAAEEGIQSARELGFNISKERTKQSLDAAKQQDALVNNFFNLVTNQEKNNTFNPVTSYAAARSMFGDSIDKRILHTALGKNLSTSLLENRGNIEEQVPLLQRMGFPEQDAEFILNQINQ